MACSREQSMEELGSIVLVLPPHNFGRFKVEVANQLTHSNCVDLAMLLEYPRSFIDELQRTSESVSQLFVSEMEGRNHISTTDIHHLTDALTQLKLDGIRKEVDTLFDTHVKKIVRKPVIDEDHRSSTPSSEDDSEETMSDFHRIVLQLMMAEMSSTAIDVKSYAEKMKKRKIITKEEYRRVKYVQNPDQMPSVFIGTLKGKPDYAYGVFRNLLEEDKRTILQDYEARAIAQEPKQRKLVRGQLQRMTTMPVRDDMLDYVLRQSTKTVNVLLIGKTGSGKSSTGNTLLGQDYFRLPNNPFGSCTKTVRKGVTREGEVTLQVMDTPGLFDSDAKRNNDEVLLEITKTALEFHDGVDVFLIVCRYDTPFTPEEKRTIAQIEEYFGEEIYSHCILVFTRGSKLSRKLSGTLKEALMGEKSPEELVCLHGKVSQRTLAIDNLHEGGKMMLHMQRTWLMTVILELVHAKESRRYDDKIFKDVRKRKRVEDDKLEKVEQIKHEMYSFLENLIREADQETLSFMLAKKCLAEKDLKCLRKEAFLRQPGNIELLDSYNITVDEVISNFLSKEISNMRQRKRIGEEVQRGLEGIAREFLRDKKKREIRQVAKDIKKGQIPTALIDKFMESLPPDMTMTRGEVKTYVKTVIISNQNVIDGIMADYKSCLRLCWPKRDSSQNGDANSRDEEDNELDTL